MPAGNGALSRVVGSWVQWTHGGVSPWNLMRWMPEGEQVDRRFRVVGPVDPRHLLAIKPHQKYLSIISFSLSRHALYAS